jgi:hypothetical protein
MYNYPKLTERYFFWKRIAKEFKILKLKNHDKNI